ncbi:MAG: hypothetical protein ACI9TV_002435 [Sulfurimonas sp.]|jgi:hypothetical protein|uniref:pyridoxamine 5'-phosphate oxidase family protein n=1 Tax=Sulfurimonas sp. TaxID=2022749 RepID=UPI0039E5B6E9
MSKQYKKLTQKDREFIQKQKLFYLASSSVGEVNLSPKGYDSIRILDESHILFMNHPGSGNRTYRDAVNKGEFTLVFNAFEGKANILRIFCKAEIIDEESSEYEKYLELYNEKKEFVRNFFKFAIYAVESSCGESVPYMEYKGDRDSIKEWMLKMDANGKLEEYKEKHFTPSDLRSLK